MFQAAMLISALEYASFDHAQIRYELVNLLNKLEEDLTDVGYEPGPAMKSIFTEFEEMLNELAESEKSDTTTKPEDEDIEEFIEETEPTNDDESDVEDEEIEV